MSETHEREENTYMHPCLHRAYLLCLFCRADNVWLEKTAAYVRYKSAHASLHCAHLLWLFRRADDVWLEKTAAGMSLFDEASSEDSRRRLLASAKSGFAGEKRS